MIDLQNGWVRMDVATPSVYYGYALSNSSLDTDNAWAIRRVTASGSVTTTDWNDKSQLQYNAKWADRTSCFTSPTASISITWSVAPSNNMFTGTISNIYISWNSLAGVNNYFIKISDQTGEIYNGAGYHFTNNYSSIYTSQQTGTSFKFKGVPSMTYSVTVLGSNSSGSTQSSVNITT
jgi:hypothetical protein